MKNAIIKKIESIVYKQCSEKQELAYIFQEKMSVVQPSLGVTIKFKTTNILVIYLIDGKDLKVKWSIQGSWKDILQKLESFTI